MQTEALDRDRRRGLWRRLKLVTPGGRVFLDRSGVDLRLFGVYVHRIELPDPGLDLHDHPWPFVSIILRGGYTEEAAAARDAQAFAAWAETVELSGAAERGSIPRGYRRTWRRGSVHRIRTTDAHRITTTEPGTLTLVLRGRKWRSWGFYCPDGFVDHRRYDYETRRPLEAVR